MEGRKLVCKHTRPYSRFVALKSLSEVLEYLTSQSFVVFTYHPQLLTHSVNSNIEHLEEIREAGLPAPAVNQIEVNDCLLCIVPDQPNHPCM